MIHLPPGLWLGGIAAGTSSPLSGDMTFKIGINADGSPTAPTIANAQMSNTVFATMCDFWKESAARPGNAGKPSTPEQRKQLIAAYEKRVREVVQEVSSKRWSSRDRIGCQPAVRQVLHSSGECRSPVRIGRGHRPAHHMATALRALQQPQSTQHRRHLLALATTQPLQRQR